MKLKNAYNHQSHAKQVISLYSTVHEQINLNPNNKMEKA